MKTLIPVLLLLACAQAYAHHTREHTMLLQDAEQVITETRQSEKPGASFLWLGLGVLLGIGAIRLLNKK